MSDRAAAAECAGWRTACHTPRRCLVMFYDGGLASRRSAESVESVQTRMVHQHDGVLVVEIAGTPYERGRQHGAALAEPDPPSPAPPAGDIVFGKGLAMGSAFMGVLYGILARMHPNIPRELREEMRGVADGARVPYRDILLLNCFDDVLHALIQLNPMLAPLLHHRFVKPVLGFLGAPPTPPSGRGFACSAFALTAEPAPSAARSTAATWTTWSAMASSIPTGSSRASFVRTWWCSWCARTEAARSRRSVWPGFVGAGDGLNDARTFAGLPDLDGLARDSERNAAAVPLPTDRPVRQHARRGRVDHARHPPDHRQQPDDGGSASTNEARSFEFTMERVAATPAANGLVTATNHFQHPAMQPLQTGWVIPSSEYRLQRLRELVRTVASASPTPRLRSPMPARLPVPPTSGTV